MSAPSNATSAARRGSSGPKKRFSFSSGPKAPPVLPSMDTTKARRHSQASLEREALREAQAARESSAGGPQRSGGASTCGLGQASSRGLGQASSRGLGQASSRVSERLSHAERSFRGLLTDFNAEARIAQKRTQRKLTRRDYLYLGLNSPSSSCWALLMAMLTVLSTLAATVSHAVSTVDGVVAGSPTTFRTLDACFAVVFTSEVLLRIVAAPGCRQMLTPLILLETVCLVPLYARLLFGSSLGGRAGSIYAAAVGPAWMRYLDSLGPLRLLKLVRYYQDAVLLGSALRRSLSALMVPLSFMAILCLCFASVLFAIEVVEEDAASGSAVAAQALHNDSTAAQIIGSSSGLSAPAGRDAGRVTNVPDAIWLMLITMTTVGYGDFYPNTSLGRFLVSCAALCGIVIIAMPLAIIGANFNEAWNGRELQLVVSRLRLLLIEQGMSVNDVFTVFQAIDDDQNGTLDFLEFRAACEKLELYLSPAVLRRVWKSLDEDGNGYIDYFEFCERCFPELGIDLGKEAKERRRQSTLFPRRSSTRGSISGGSGSSSRQSRSGSVGSVSTTGTGTGTGTRKNKRGSVDGAKSSSRGSRLGSCLGQMLESTVATTVTSLGKVATKTAVHFAGEAEGAFMSAQERAAAVVNPVSEQEVASYQQQRRASINRSMESARRASIQIALKKRPSELSAADLAQIMKFAPKGGGMAGGPPPSRGSIDMMQARRSSIERRFVQLESEMGVIRDESAEALKLLRQLVASSNLAPKAGAVAQPRKKRLSFSDQDAMAQPPTAQPLPLSGSPTPASNAFAAKGFSWPGSSPLEA